jgi:predicted dehydrogenase
MNRIRIGIIGTTPTVEWAILPVLIGSDAVSPPDTGAWWSRRPTPSGDIRYQSPTIPEVVAICDFPENLKPKSKAIQKVSPRIEALARQYRLPSVYSDPQRMLREAELDAIFLAQHEDIRAAQLVSLIATSPGVHNKIPVPRWLWVDGPPAASSLELNVFASSAVGHPPALWMAAPLRRAAAHRAARRLLERDELGPVTAIQARFAFPFDESRFEQLYAAFDLLISFVPVTQMPEELFASKHSDGATSLLIRFNGGATITALFAASDVWNSPLPRIEICGTQGRFLVCESGRKITHYVPREGARVWEPPGLAPHLSSANLSGYGEDIKAFLAICADNPAPFNVERALRQSARSLSVIESAFTALETGMPTPIKPRGIPAPEEIAVSKAEAKAESFVNLTLDLS